MFLGETTPTGSQPHRLLGTLTNDVRFRLVGTHRKVIRPHGENYGWK